MTLVGTVRDCLFRSSLEVMSDQTTTISVDVRDTTVEGRALVLANGPGAPSATFERCVFRDDVQLDAHASGATVSADLESCLLVGPGATSNPGPWVVPSTPPGSTVAFDAVNCTVTGHSHGVRATAACFVANALIFDNDTDVGSSPAAAFHTSLIEDGAHDGVNGNFAATPHVDGDYGPLPCSPGIDAGNTLLPGIGPHDLYGDARFQDNDGDLVPEINVGAVESSGASPSSVTGFNGSGVNPPGLDALTPPVVGTTLTLAVGIFPDTGATIVGFDAPNEAPILVPGLTGEVFLALSGGLVLNVAPIPGLHQQPVPPGCAFVGNTVRCQGFLWSPSAGFEALNALDLVVGTE